MMSMDCYSSKSLKEQFGWNSQITNEECNILLKTALECGKYDAIFETYSKGNLGNYMLASLC